jgi:hypothetical protein
MIGPSAKRFVRRLKEAHSATTGSAMGGFEPCGTIARLADVIERAQDGALEDLEAFRRLPPLLRHRPSM